MDVETRLDLLKGIGEEIITVDELRNLLETKRKPVAYDGFEPSGVAHLPVGVYRPLILKDLLKAKVHFKLWVADWFGWMNNKMGGDLEKIRTVGKYFIEVWKAAGVDTSKVDVIWASEAMDNKEYWKRVISIGRNTTLNRMLRCTQIMGRSSDESLSSAQVFYPAMQASDIFHLKADICQLGMDQRKVNMLAREIAPKIGATKPVAVHHHMLMGLAEPKVNKDMSAVDRAIEMKMSKSKPTTCIYMHDSRKDIAKKISKAFCPAKVVENNPMMDYSKEIIFRAFDTFKIERPAKFGGDLEFASYEELEKTFVKGDLHPMDLKSGVADHLDKLIAPVRTHFEKNKKAKELYKFVSSQQITR